jgi:hypothetical protein
MNPEDAAAAMTPDGEITGDTVNREIPEGDREPTPERAEDVSAAGGSQSMKDRLLNTEPDQSLESVQSPWNPKAGGPSRVYRGIQKLGDIEGLPAIADIAIGFAEVMYQVQGADSLGDSLGDSLSGGGDGDDSDDSEETDDVDVSELAL